MQAMLPQYQFVALLGRGGMGAVYRAVQISLDRPVAIKVLPGDLFDDRDANFAERFKNEARTMAKMNHPGIVNVYDFGEAPGGLLYIVMEFVDGTDVSDMIKRQGRLPAEYALAITAHVCDALQYAHGRGVVHRDIKPANVLINMEGQVKVADFGLAKGAETQGSTTALTQTNMTMGTPDFVAPEALVQGMSSDSRADLYSVGVMLYNMLTGGIPRGVFAPASRKAGTDPRFDAIILRAMEEDRQRRYQSAADIRRDLDAILSTPIVKAAETKVVAAAVPQQMVARRKQVTTPQRRTSSRRRSRKGGTGAMLGIVSLLLAGGGVYVMLRHAHVISTGRTVPAVEKQTSAVIPTASVAPVVPSTSMPPVTTPPADPVRSPPVSSAPAAVKPGAASPPTTTSPSNTPTVRSTVPADPVEDHLTEMQTGFRAVLKRDVEKVFDDAVSALNKSYVDNGISRARSEAVRVPDTLAVAALDGEKTRMSYGWPVPDSDHTELAKVVKQLRNTYRLARMRYEAERDRKAAALYDGYLKDLGTYAQELQSAGNSTGAAKVLARQRDVAVLRSQYGLADSATLLPAYRSRCSSAERLLRLADNGVAQDVDDAVRKALSWFKGLQNSDGAWGTQDRAGLTGLALLCYLGRCETPDSPVYGDTVMKGLLYLIETSKKNVDGVFTTQQPAGSHSTYEHAIAVSALAEAHGLSRTGGKSLPGLREALEKGVQVMLKHELPEGGWAYPNEANTGAYRDTGNGDPSVTGWHVQALLAVQRSGLLIPKVKEALEHSARYFELRQTDDGGFGLRNRKAPAYTQWTMTGIGLITLQARGGIETQPMKRAVKFAADFFGKETPSWNNVNLYSWYYYTQAFLRHGGVEWQAWNDTALRLLVAQQESNGTWKWKGAGAAGDLYSTALATLMLEACYRY